MIYLYLVVVLFTYMTFLIGLDDVFVSTNIGIYVFDVMYCVIYLYLYISITFVCDRYTKHKKAGLLNSVAFSTTYHNMKIATVDLLVRKSCCSPSFQFEAVLR